MHKNGEMMSKEATMAFREGLDNLIWHMKKEWNLTYSECVGVLELTKMDIWSEATGGDDEDEED